MCGNGPFTTSDGPSYSVFLFLASILNPQASRKANIQISICSSITITPPSTPSGPRQPAQPPIVDVAEEEGDEENTAAAVRGRGGGRRSKRIRGHPPPAAEGGGRGHPPAKRGRGGRYVMLLRVPYRVFVSN